MKFYGYRYYDAYYKNSEVDEKEGTMYILLYMPRHYL